MCVLETAFCFGMDCLYYMARGLELRQVKYYIVTNRTCSRSIGVMFGILILNFCSAVAKSRGRVSDPIKRSQP